MEFGTAIKTCFSKYVTFSGRASRSEFWWYTLFNILGAIVARILDLLAGTSFHMTMPNGSSVSMGYGYILSLYALVVVLPTLSVAVRRLHDRNRSGWWYWLFLVPFVGGIWLIFWFCRRGTSGENRFGPNPLAASVASPAEPV
jgi:uncharacterized membrane protein YhaH (DUF805 family)